MAEGQSAQLVIPGTKGKVKIKRRTALLLAGGAAVVVLLLIRRRGAEEGQAEESFDSLRPPDEPPLPPADAGGGGQSAASDLGLASPTDASFYEPGLYLPDDFAAFAPLEAPAPPVEPLAPVESFAGGGGGGFAPELAAPVGGAGDEPDFADTRTKPPALSGQVKGAPSGAPAGSIRQIGGAQAAGPRGWRPSVIDPSGLLRGSINLIGGALTPRPSAGIRRITDRVSAEAAQRAQAAGRDKTLLPPEFGPRDKGQEGAANPPPRRGRTVPPRPARIADRVAPAGQRRPGRSSK